MEKNGSKWNLLRLVEKGVHCIEKISEIYMVTFFMVYLFSGICVLHGGMIIKEMHLPLVIKCTLPVSSVCVLFLDIAKKGCFISVDLIMDIILNLVTLIIGTQIVYPANADIMVDLSAVSLAVCALAKMVRNIVKDRIVETNPRILGKATEKRLEDGKD